MLQTKYITLDEFKEFTGIDLEKELETRQSALAFIYRNEVRLASYLDCNYFQKVDLLYPEFSDYQKQEYKYALLEQGLYVFKNGDVSVDSGYDYESGLKITPGQRKNIVLSPNAEEHLINCGLLSRELYKGPNVGGGFFPFGGWY